MVAAWIRQIALMRTSVQSHLLQPYLGTVPEIILGGWLFFFGGGPTLRTTQCNFNMSSGLPAPPHIPRADFSSTPITYRTNFEADVPHPEDKKKCVPTPLDNFWNSPLSCSIASCRRSMWSTMTSPTSCRITSTVWVGLGVWAARTMALPSVLFLANGTLISCGG